DSRLALGDLALNEGDGPTAEVDARRALEDYRSENNPGLIAHAETSLALALLAQKKLPEARQAIVDAGQLLTDQGNRLTVVVGDAQIRAASGKAGEAEDLLRKAVDDCRKFGLHWQLLEARLYLGQTMIQEGKTAEGQRELYALEHEASSK